MNYKSMPKTYTIQITESSEGFSIKRKNDGFTSIELLGHLEFIQQEIIEQMRGDIKPDIVKREYVDKN